MRKSERESRHIGFVVVEAVIISHGKKKRSGKTTTCASYPLAVYTHSNAITAPLIIIH